MKTILKMENVKKSFGSGHNEIQFRHSKESI